MKKLIMLLLSLGALNNVEANPAGQQILINGNFADNDCRQDWCFYNSGNHVRGWVPSPEIQMGFGSNYNRRLGRERVIELATDQNTCLFQRVRNLTPGTYQLKYEYAARDGKTFDDCQFKVSFNNRELKHVIPRDYNLNTDSVDFDVRQGCQGEIRFCGFGGQNNSQGAVLRSVSLVRKENPLDNQQSQKVQSLILDSHSGKCFEKQYKIQGGDHQISLDYKILADFAIRDSAVYITINQQPIYKIFASQNGKNIKVLGKINKGNYRIGLCTIGAQNQRPHQIQITNFAVSYKQCSGAWGNDLIINGGFEQNQCKSLVSCFWNRQIAMGKVPGWQVSKEMEIGKARLYNNAMGDSWAMELDANSNTCVKQRVALTPGKYSLRFDWAAKSRYALDTSEFEAKINGRVLKSIKPENYNANQESIEFDLSDCPSESWVEFCGSGRSDSHGAIIDNVKLFKFEKCASTKFTKY